MSRYARAHPDDPEMWAAPPLHADVPVTPPPCDGCGGHGVWEITHEDAYGHDVDSEYECPRCNGTGDAA